MKFAHEFKDALIKEGFPPHWVESAIPYSQLKKCIKKVEKELQSLGLDSATLAQLYPDTPEEQEPNREIVGFEYDFESRLSAWQSPAIANTIQRSSISDQSSHCLYNSKTVLLSMLRYHLTPESILRDWLQIKDESSRRPLRHIQLLKPCKMTSNKIL